MNRKETFCIMPFVHLHNMSNGLLKMCCLVEKPIINDFGDTYFVGNQPIETVWNSNFLKSARKMMLNNQEVNICHHCYSIEDNGGKSLRQEYNEQYSKKYIKIVEESKNNDFNVTTFPPFVELRSGNKCNTSCRMCNPNDSSLVLQEHKKIHLTLRDTNLSPETKSNGYNMLGNPERIIFGNTDSALSKIISDIDKHYNEIIEHITEIDTLTLSGGEPFLLEKTVELFEQIREKNPNLRLNINTNGSISSDRILNAIQSMNDVRLCVSLDGYGSVQEYIRYPLKWNKIEENINSFYNSGNKNLHLSFNCTVQTFNILDLDTMILFLVRKYPKTFLNLSVLENPNFLNIKILPKEVREHAINKLNNLINELKTIIDPITEHNILQLVTSLTTIISILEQSTGDAKFFGRFLDNIKIYDLYRNQDIKQMIPNWITYL